MKLAWICYSDDEENFAPSLVFVEPERWQYHRVVPIVYAVLETDDE